MSIAVVDRRRVLAFAEALDRPEQMGSGPAPSRGATHGDGQGDEVVAAALRTAAMLCDEGAAGPVPTADFRAALRGRLLEEASALPAAASVPAPRGAHRRPAPVPKPRAVRWRRRCAVAATALVVTAGGLGGIAVASSDALPGDMTYGVKRTVEDIKMSMAGSDRERGERYLEQARTRLSEAERLLDREGGGAIDKGTIGHLRGVLDDAREETAHGRALLTESYESSDQTKIGPMKDLADFARSGTERMERMADRLPGEVAAERDMVWQLLYDIHKQVSPIPGALAPDDADDIEAALPAGPGKRNPTGPAGPAAPGGRPQPPVALPDVAGIIPPAIGQAPANAPGSGASPAPAATSTAGLLPQVNVPLLAPTRTDSGSPSQSPSPLGLDVPAPVLPPVGLNVPPLLPGLPGIGITIGGAPQTPDEE
ncbi:DUF5667 domain-containing protein [Yinghuangia sp. YIM S09857]|uniref:DUF5667 domain-containing protein n=1 Tax=Yinghuangia sp. YIM S09857 TaxID=3436929 RepID=UPI003F53A416